MRKSLLFLFFWGSLATALVVYWPGLQGGFLFDDAPNLSPLATYGGVDDLETFKSFVFQGFAGPLGRPIALASFVLDANYWPASPGPFKWTNLCIHLLVAVVLAWATLNLLRFYGVDEQTACWGAVLNMALWMLHPYMVSTTLYVVQRMAQLAALFMFAGLAGYLHGRSLLVTRPRAAYAWMSVSLALGTVLAAFSKENGVLLPLLALIAEWCAPRRHTVLLGAAPSDNTRPDWRWQAGFLWAPSGLVAMALLREINFSSDPWPTRPFNQVERLWSEARILWEYLYHLFIPRIEGRGLFQDAFTLSTGWLQPVSTLVSVLGLLALFFFALWVRKKSLWGALVALAILFFLASHLVESTVVGLELYFEHRNYASSAFLFLPMVMGLLWVSEHKSRFVGVSALAVTIAMLGGLTWQRATLWSNTQALQSYWAVASPESARAQNYLAAQMFNQGHPDKAISFLREASARMPESALLSMQLLLMKVQLHQAGPGDFERVRQLLPYQRFDAQALVGIRSIAEILSGPVGSPADREQALGLLDAMESLPNYRKIALFQRMLPYLRGLLLMGQGNLNKATAQMLEAMHRYQDVDAALSMVAEMAGAGHYVQARQLLDAARNIYRQQPDRTLKRSRTIYDAEFKRLARMLQEDMSAQK